MSCTEKINKGEEFMAHRLIKLSLIFSILLMCLPIEVQAESNKNVLFISSNSPGFISFNDQVKGIKEAIGNRAVLQVEYMDSKTFNSEENETIFYHLLKYKLNNYEKFDAIIIGDDSALEFALQYREELFKDIPLIFLGINNLELANEAIGNELVYGVGEEPSIDDTIGFINKIHKPKNIIAVTDKPIEYAEEIEQFYILQYKYNNVQLKHISLGDITFEEFEEKIQRFNEDEDVLLIIYAFRDKTEEIDLRMK